MAASGRETLEQALAGIDRQMSAGDWETALSRINELIETWPDDINLLGRRAQCLMALGQTEQAADAAEQALAAGPGLPGLQRGMAPLLLQAGRVEKGLQVLESAAAANPRDAGMHLELARAAAGQGRDDQALSHIAAVMAMEPGLRTPNAADRMRSEGEAEVVRWMQGQLSQRLYALHRRLLSQSHVQKAPPSARERMVRFVRGFYDDPPLAFRDRRQRPSFQYYPEAEPRPWYEREEFDWVPALEARWKEIRAEWEAAAEQARLNPYVTDVPGSEGEEWQALNESLRWGAVHLYRAGEAVPENARLFPETRRAVDELPLIRTPGHAPEVFFSLLRPGTHIPPHVGLANTKLAIHLPLIIPDNCAIRVGGETRGWTPGEVRIFDDSFEHEAWNDSDQPRLVLIAEIWNPQLTPEEQCFLQDFMAILDGWNHWLDNVDPANPDPPYNATNVLAAD